MKNLKFICVLAAVIVTGCTKNERIKPEVQAVLNYHMVNSDYMTKTIADGEVTNAISALLPESIELTLKNKSTGETITANSGEQITLTVGEYTVTGKYEGGDKVYLAGSAHYMSNRAPSISINTTLNVTYDVSSYEVAATYNCFAIVIDLNEASTASYTSSHGESGSVSFLKTGNVGIVFAHIDLSKFSLIFTVYPSVGGLKQTTFTFSDNGTANEVRALYSKYYVVHPSAINSVDNGVIALNLPSWSRVDLEE